MAILLLVNTITQMRGVFATILPLIPGKLLVRIAIRIQHTGLMYNTTAVLLSMLLAQLYTLARYTVINTVNTHSPLTPMQLQLLHLGEPSHLPTSKINYLIPQPQQ
ncbi:hypothetical protein ES705_41366 [subsurface metagenome]